MTIGWEVLVLLPVLVGALSQRVTGLGFALVAAPFVVLIFGPDAGVLLVNACSLVVASIGAVMDHRRLEPRRLFILVPFGIVGTVLGVLMAGVLQRAILEISIGVLLALGLAVTLTLRTTNAVRSPRAAGIIAGTTSGISAGLAGLSGPPLVMYAKLTDWRGRGMTASFQVMFVSMSATAVTLKLLSGTLLPSTEPWFWLAMVSAIALGLLVGHFLVRIVPARLAWVTVIVIAFAGSVAAIVHGVVTLVLST